MTNLEYRKSRGTDKPFTATPEQAEKAWAKLQKARAKAEGRVWPPRKMRPMRNFRIYDVED